jgi:hypothetical protein
MVFFGFMFACSLQSQFIAEDEKPAISDFRWAALCPRACMALLKLVDHAIEIGIACAKLLREPVAAALGNYFAVRDYLELTGLTRRKHRINSQSLLDEGHETRDLNLIVLSCWTVNDFDFHWGLQFAKCML